MSKISLQELLTLAKAFSYFHLNFRHWHTQQTKTLRKKPQEASLCQSTVWVKEKSKTGIHLLDFSHGLGRSLVFLLMMAIFKSNRSLVNRQ